MCAANERSEDDGMLNEDVVGHRERRVMIEELNLSTVKKLQEAPKNDPLLDLRPHLVRARLDYNDAYPDDQEIPTDPRKGK